MDFFESQRTAKKLTNKLIFLFYTLVLLISFGTAALITFLAFRREFPDPFQVDLISGDLWGMILLISSVVAGLILIRFFFETRSLKSDPSSICTSLGAYQVEYHNDDFKLKQYINIVQEMSLASSVPVPAIFVLNDDAINAFACGYDINSAAICVTTGSLDKLNRDELQSVVAHEFSHILNGDMTINLKLLGMLAGLLMIFHAGYFILRSSGGRRSRSNSKDGGGAVALAIALMAVGGVGFLGGRILKSLISRQREYLADASSVQFTRNPSGMVGALKKILVNASQGYLASPQADKASHMYLVAGVKNFFSMSTHPPLDERIRAIDKSFNQKKFFIHEAKKIEKSMIEEIHTAAEEVKEDKAEAFKDHLMHLVLLYQGKKQAGNFMLNLLKKEKEFAKLSDEELLKMLEEASAWAKGLETGEQKKILKELVAEINKDKKIDFYEFLVFAYLKPALKSVKIAEKTLSDSDYKAHAKVLKSFFIYLDENTYLHNEEIIPREELSYSKIMKSIEKIRFSSAAHKENLLEDVRKIAHLNSIITEKERVIFKLLCHTLAVPGQEL